MDKIEKIDKSLEEAALGNYYGGGYIPKNQELREVALKTKEVQSFVAGAEWQASQMPMPEDTVLFNKGVAEGRRLERNDLLKDAVEGEVIKTDKHTSVRYKSFYGTDRYFYGIADKQFKPGDKVRLIILKAEEE